jgi:small GTP-binding protein
MRELTYKLCIFGNGSVGKTTMLHRYLTNEFILNTKITLGLDIDTKRLSFENSNVTLQIWDFGGEERFRFLLPSYTRGSSGGIFMFDLTRPETLDDIDEWITIFRNGQNKNFPVPIFLVGGKLDLVETRVISEKKIKGITKSFKFANYFESSAKTGQNIERIFNVLIQTIMERAGHL